MFEKLVTNETREGTIVFVEKGKVLLLIDTVFHEFTIHSGLKAVEVLVSYGVTVADLTESEVIAEDNGIIIYFLEA